MELLRIGDNKLKVTLTGEDMERYSLDGESMDYDTTETRSAFWQILDEAKRQTGFDACGAKIFVQVYPSRAGGCEMYVTRVSEGETAEPPPAEVREGIYVFSCLSHLLSVCRALTLLGYGAPSAAYTADGEYYLIIRERQLSGLGARTVSEYGFIEEYGVRLLGGVRLAYLREHGRCLASEGAVEQFAALA